MKTYLIPFILLFISVASFAQTGQVALGDTAGVQSTRGKYHANAAGVPMFKVGLQPGRRLAFFTDIPTQDFLDGRYVQSGVVLTNPSFIGSLAGSKITGLAAVALSGKFPDLTQRPNSIAGYGITDADPYLSVPIKDALNALVFAAGTGRRVLVSVDNSYLKNDGSPSKQQWYNVWADDAGIMHAEKQVTITEK
jgi:hypothetical protein